MAVNQFKGIKFENPPGKNMCFSNSASNGLLSSVHFTAELLNQGHYCVSCDFFNKLKNPIAHSANKSSDQLKNWIGFLHREFNNDEQQDPCELIQHIIDKCTYLCELTKTGVFKSYKCLKCQFESQNEETRNILYADLHGRSTSEIISKAVKYITKVMKMCDNCHSSNYHELVEKILVFPKILILCLKRFRVTSSNRPVGKNCSKISPDS